jgi:ABC-type spermidine/putrescine transport system permease subunit II/streptogramin lyase
LLAPALLLVLLRRAETSWPRDAAADTAPALRRSLGITELCCAAILAVLTWLLALIVPVAQLAATPRTWSEFLPALTAGTNAMTNSFVYAAVASIFSAAIAIVLARTTKLGWLWFFFFVPGIMLGIGASVGFSRPGLDFFSRTIAIVIALLIVRYIAIARSITRNGILSIDRELIDAGRLDGARGWKLFWHVGFPQVAGEIAVAAYFVYLLCLWDVETILFVIPPGGETLALRIFNLLHYGHNAHVNALCMLLLLLAIAPLLAWQLFQLVRKAISKTALGMIFAVAIGATGCSQRKQSDSVSFPIRSSIFSSVEIIGSRGTGAGQFNKPRSLALDTNDNLFVVDMTGRVQKFSPDGKFVLSWQMPETDLGKPKGMCRDRDGNIVILEPHYQRVNHFTPGGKLVVQWGVKGTNAGELTLPRAVAVDTKNNVIVPEYTLVDRVQKFSAYGKRCLVTWGTPGLAPGQFNRAEGVDVDSADRIYIADSCNHRIQIFSGNGKFLRTYGKAGKGIGEMNYPSDIRVDEQGRQYVCEFGGNRIQVFDSNDRPLESIGKAGDAPGEFHEPWSIAFDSKLNLYVADALNHRVQKFLRRK